MTQARRNFVQFNAHGYQVFKAFANETVVNGLLEAVTSRSFDPEWVEIHNWGTRVTGSGTGAKRWMAAAPECAQRFFMEDVVPFLKNGGFYSTEHDITLGRGVAVLR
jgi:hypothetical protein